MTPHVTWQEQTNDRIRHAFIRYRQAANLRVQDVADRTTKIGLPMTRDVLTNFERGRKRALDIPELIVLATALEVEPISLIFPGIDTNAEVEYLPEDLQKTWSALSLFAGLSEDQDGPIRVSQDAKIQWEEAIDAARQGVSSDAREHSEDSKWTRDYGRKKYGWA